MKPQDLHGYVIWNLKLIKRPSKFVKYDCVERELFEIFWGLGIFTFSIIWHENGQWFPIKKKDWTIISWFIRFLCFQSLVSYNFLLYIEDFIQAYSLISNTFKKKNSS